MRSMQRVMDKLLDPTLKEKRLYAQLKEAFSGDLEQAFSSPDLRGQNKLNQGKVNRVAGLLRQLGWDSGSDLSSRHGTLLHLAAQEGDRNLIEFLLIMRRYAPHAPLNDSISAQIHGAYRAHYQFVHLKDGAVAKDINRPSTNYGSTPLMAAVISGKLDAVRYLLSLGANDTLTLTADHPKSGLKRGDTPLIAAIKKGHMEIAQALIGGKMQDDAPHRQPLIRDAISLLLTKTPQVEGTQGIINMLAQLASDETKANLLLDAVSTANSQLVTLLLENNPSVTPARLSTALCYAVELGEQHIEIFQALLAQGASILTPPDKRAVIVVDKNHTFNLTPLNHAVSLGKTKVVKRMLASDAFQANNINRKIEMLNDAIQIALMQKQDNIAYRLIEELVKLPALHQHKRRDKGIDHFTSELPQRLLKASLVEAVERNRVNVVKFILETAKTEPAVTNQYELTPDDKANALLLAAKHGKTDIALQLLQEPPFSILGQPSNPNPKMQNYLTQLLNAAPKNSECQAVIDLAVYILKTNARESKYEVKAVGFKYGEDSRLAKSAQFFGIGLHSKERKVQDAQLFLKARMGEQDAMDELKNNPAAHAALRDGQLKSLCANVLERNKRFLTELRSTENIRQTQQPQR